MAIPPTVLPEMTLRQIQSCLDALAGPEPVDEREAQMMQHPALRGR